VEIVLLPVGLLGGLRLRFVSGAQQPENVATVLQGRDETGVAPQSYQPCGLYCWIAAVSVELGADCRQPLSDMARWNRCCLCTVGRWPKRRPAAMGSGPRPPRASAMCLFSPELTLALPDEGASLPSWWLRLDTSVQATSIILTPGMAPRQGRARRPSFPALLCPRSIHSNHVAVRSSGTTERTALTTKT